jgi:hypothetical protein
MPFCILNHLTGFGLDEQRLFFPDGVVPWKAACASKFLRAMVRDGLLTVQNVRVNLNHEGGFNSVSLTNYGLKRWKENVVPLTRVEIDVYISSGDLTWYLDDVRRGFDQNKINVLSTVCENLISYNPITLKELKFHVSDGDLYKCFEAGIKVIPNLQVLTILSIVIPNSYKMTLSSFPVINGLTSLTSLSYSGYTFVKSEDKTSDCVLFDFLSTKLETLRVHDYVDWMCADVIHPFVVSAFATRVSAGGFAALRVLEYISGETYLEPTSLRTFLDMVAKLSKLTDFKYGAHRSHYRRLQVPHIHRLTLERPDLRVVFEESSP